jgi:hypothetical protein
MLLIAFRTFMLYGVPHIGTGDLIRSLLVMLMGGF